jgi:hypothetical protein
MPPRMRIAKPTKVKIGSKLVGKRVVEKSV